MLFRETVADYCENHMEHTDARTLCGHNAEFQCCDMMAETGILEQEETSVVRLRHGTQHFSVATVTRNNGGVAGNSVFYWVRAKAITRTPRESFHSYTDHVARLSSPAITCIV
jgi:hypothetical protein